jgi:hypothetical protein
MMTTTALVQRTQARDFSAHHILLNAARCSIQVAESSEVGRFNNCLVAMTMTALAVEALVNAVGKRIASDWDAFVWLRPEAKLQTLRTLLAYNGDLADPPWPALHEIKLFRDAIAHAKPEAISTSNIVKASEAHRVTFPESELEKQITLHNAKRMFDAVEQLKMFLHSHLPDELRPGIYVDGWVGSESAAACSTPSKKRKSRRRFPPA